MWVLFYNFSTAYLVHIQKQMITLIDAESFMYAFAHTEVLVFVPTMSTKGYGYAIVDKSVITYHISNELVKVPAPILNNVLNTSKSLHWCVDFFRLEKLPYVLIKWVLKYTEKGEE